MAITSGHVRLTFLPVTRQFQITRKGWREEWVPEIMVIIGKSLKLQLPLRQLLVGTKAAGSPGNVFRVH